MISLKSLASGAGLARWDSSGSLILRQGLTALTLGFPAGCLLQQAAGCLTEGLRLLSSCVGDLGGRRWRERTAEVTSFEYTCMSVRKITFCATPCEEEVASLQDTL